LHSRRLIPLYSSEDRVGDGNYDAYIDNPDVSNALAGTAVWEHVLLRSHYSPKVREASKAVMKNAILK